MAPEMTGRLNRPADYRADGYSLGIAFYDLLTGEPPFSVTIVNRNADRGGVLVDLLNRKTGASATFLPWDGTVEVPDNTDILVNATSVGLYPNVDQRLDVNTESLRPHMVVADGIHNPPRTHLLNGLGMLVNQAVIGLKYWTGVDADAAVMRLALEEVLADGD